MKGYRIINNTTITNNIADTSGYNMTTSIINITFIQFPQLPEHMNNITSNGEANKITFNVKITINNGRKRTPIIISKGKANIWKIPISNILGIASLKYHYIYN